MSWWEICYSCIQMKPDIHDLWILVCTVFLHRHQEGWAISSGVSQTSVWSVVPEYLTHWCSRHLHFPEWNSASKALKRSCPIYILTGHACLMFGLFLSASLLALAKFALLGFIQYLNGLHGIFMRFFGPHTVKRKKVWRFRNTILHHCLSNCLPPSWAA